jgi:hypothetical protein
MRLYTRALPGGGMVMIEHEVGSTQAVHHARLIVERRADAGRRDGHSPPVIAEAIGETADEVFHHLYPIACDNVQIARALRSLQERPSGAEGRY